MDTLLRLEHDWIYNKTVYYSPPTLYKLATVKTAISLWYKEEFWLWTTYRVNEDLQQKIIAMRIPKTIKPDIALMVEFVQSQLRELLKLMPNDIFIPNRWDLLQETIHWTSDGLIDQKSTAESLADSSKLDLKVRFQIAAVFFLEERIHTLAAQLPTGSYLPDDNYNRFSTILLMGVIPIAEKFFQCFETRYTDKMNLQTMLWMKNASGSLHYWHRLNEQEKIKFLNETEFNEDYDCNDFLFLFTHCDREKRVQLLNNERHLCTLLEQLLGLQWLTTFNACIKDALNYLAVDSLVDILRAAAEKVRSTIAYKQKFIAICATLLQCLCGACSIPDSWTNSNQRLIKSMTILVEEGEVTLVKHFLESISNEWMERLLFCDLTFFIKASFRHGILEFMIISAFPTIEEREKSLTLERFEDFVLISILHCNKMEDIDRFLRLRFSNLEDMKRYKMKLVEEKSCQLCYSFFDDDDEESEKKSNKASKFIHWCFDSEEEKNIFYNKFFRSKYFAKLFYPEFSDIDDSAIARFIKGNNLQQLPNVSELIIDACQNIFSFWMDIFYYKIDKDTILLFLAVDSFLLTFTEDEQKLMDLKKGIFKKNAEIIISLAVEFLCKEISHHEPGYRKKRLKLWKKIVDDYFNWMFSSELFKKQLRKKFWNSKEVIEAKKKLYE